MLNTIVQIEANPKKKYHVVLWYNDNKTAILMHRNRTAWRVETARKHLRDIITRKVAGEFPDVRTCTLVLA